MSEYKVKIYPNKKSPRLFKNKLLELLTKTHPLVIDVMYVILTSLAIRYYYINHSQDVLHIILGFFLGVLSWSLAEYLMHRFLYHNISDARYDSGFQYMFHGVHHKFPTDENRLVLPPLPSLIISFILFCLFYFIMGPYAFVFASGFLISYIAYMNIHYIVHKYPAPKKFHFWWTHHSIHHYQQHDRAFGVSSSLWDWIFGTMPSKGRKTVKIELNLEGEDKKN